MWGLIRGRVTIWSWNIQKRLINWGNLYLSVRGHQCQASENSRRTHKETCSCYFFFEKINLGDQKRLHAPKAEEIFGDIATVGEKEPSFKKRPWGYWHTENGLGGGRAEGFCHVSMNLQIQGIMPLWLQWLDWHKLRGTWLGVSNSTHKKLMFCEQQKRESWLNLETIVRFGKVFLWLSNMLKYAKTWNKWPPINDHSFFIFLFGLKHTHIQMWMQPTVWESRTSSPSNGAQRYSGFWCIGVPGCENVLNNHVKPNNPFWLLFVF